MSSRRDRNGEYVNRTHIKRWMLNNARPAAVRDLYETIKDSHEDLMMRTDELELEMLASVYLQLTGKDIEYVIQSEREADGCDQGVDSNARFVE